MSETERAPDAVGWEIGGTFYPFPIEFKLGDPVLIRELTGLSWEEFAELLPDENDADNPPIDPLVNLGLIGVAVSKKNPTWRRERVIRYVQGLGMNQVESVGPEPEEGAPKEDDPRPPGEEAGEQKSETSASDSPDGDTSSDESQPTTGEQSLATGSPV